MRTSLLVSVVAVVLVASTGIHAQNAAARYQGKPKFSEGKALGYFIWQDGDTWKVRWTTFGGQHVFTGSVLVEGGELKDFKHIDVDTERRVIAPGRPARVVRGPRGRVVGVRPGRGAVVATREEDRIEQETEHAIRFIARTDDDIDGFDFKTTATAEVIRFELRIDSRRQPGEIEVGKDNFKPEDDPLIVRLR